MTQIKLDRVAALSHLLQALCKMHLVANPQLNIGKNVGPMKQQIVLITRPGVAGAL